MWSSSDALVGLVPNCLCGATYDLRFCAPHTLPCAHTFCLMCLSKDKQRKKRRCPSCQKKYSSFILNVTLAEVVERVRQRREWMEGQSRRCDECESRRPVVAMRRCVTCVRDIGKHMTKGCTLDCVICLECCVDRHNGHEFIAVGSPPSCSSRTTFPPVASSTPRLGTPRYISWRACTSKNGEASRKARVELRSPMRSVNSDIPRVPITTSVIEDELVFETRSPLYYHLTSPFSEVVPNKISVVKRLSGIIRNIASSRTSVINQKDSKNQSSCCRKDSSSSNGPTFSDSSLYQRISPCPQNLQRMTCTSESILNGVGRQSCPHYYVNLPRRHSD